MGNRIEVAGWKKASCGDGPGIRSVLFLQGCSMNCPGCHNAMAQKSGAGTYVDVDALAAFVLENCHNKRLTISGGEPLEQWDSLKKVLYILKQKGFEVCIYTGWSKNRIPEEVFLIADYVKYGSFVYELQNEHLKYVGSENQKMLKKDLFGVWKEINLSA